MSLPVQFTPDHELDAIHSLLATWNAEADRFRLAAIAAGRGETPASSVVNGLAEAHTGLVEVLEATDRMVDTMRGGNAAFAAVLQVQATAAALLESLSTSLDVLDRFLIEPVDEPLQIAHRDVDRAPELHAAAG
jgi:hypothetical protein